MSIYSYERYLVYCIMFQPGLAIEVWYYCVHNNGVFRLPVLKYILLIPDTHTVVFVLSCLFMAFVIYFWIVFTILRIFVILATMSGDARSILIRFQYSSGVCVVLCFLF